MAKTFLKLTRPQMRQLECGSSICEHGIIFNRGHDGDGVFSVNVMVDGERIHRVIGRESDGTTRTQAEEFIQKVRQDARLGRLALPKGRKLALAFDIAAKRYIAKLEEEGGKDMSMKRSRLESHLIPFFGAPHSPRLPALISRDTRNIGNPSQRSAAKQRVAKLYMANLPSQLPSIVSWLCYHI